MTEVDDPESWHDRMLRLVRADQRTPNPIIDLTEPPTPADIAAAAWLTEWAEGRLQTPQDDETLRTGLAAAIIDWPAFWAKDEDEHRWLYEPVIPARRGTMMYAAAGIGKSYIARELALLIATSTNPIDVLYIDYEMTEDDLRDFLEEHGYGPETDLTHFHYALLPSFPRLDTKEGGEILVATAKTLGCTLVIIDTFSRAVKAEENDASTAQNFYQHTGLHLKREDIAWIRLDHAGKDPTQGARGSSAKNDDVDLIWNLTKSEENHVTLTATKRRMGWCPEKVILEHYEENGIVGHRLASQSVATYPPGTKETAERLDALGQPVDISTRRAQKALREAELGTRRNVVIAAVRYRREQAGNQWMGTIRNQHSAGLRPTHCTPLGVQGVQPGSGTPPNEDF